MSYLKNVLFSRVFNRSLSRVVGLRTVLWIGNNFIPKTVIEISDDGFFPIEIIWNYNNVYIIIETIKSKARVY